MQNRKQKFLSFLLVLALIICSVPAFSLSVGADSATSGKCGNNAFWDYDSTTKTLTISGTGGMWGYNRGNGILSPWSKYDISTIIIGNSITSIGIYAFDNCHNLASITIPNSITSIGVGSFRACWKLISIEIPNSVTSIGSNAFYDCGELTSVTIGNGTIDIETGAFYYCSGLTSLTVDSNNTKYYSEGNCIIEKSTNTLICGCKNSVIPNSVTSIGWGAFYGCGLKSIEIPNSVTSIENDAFGCCIGLKSIAVDNNNPNYYSEGNCLIEKLSKTLILGCENSVIPNGVTSVGNSAFYSCWGLTSIEIPNSVTSIGGGAFSQCTGLTSITIPNSVTSIGDVAFNACFKLKGVYYSGTAEQRNKIRIDSYNTNLTNATWHYNCTPEHAKVLIKIDKKGSTLKANYLKTAIQKQKNAKPTDSEYNLRLISMLDCLEDYKEVGFYITIAGYNDGENDEPIKYSTDTVYTSFLNGNTRVKASDYGAEYFIMSNIEIPNEYYSSDIKIKPYIMFADGTEFLGNEITTTVSKYIK